MFEQHHDFLTNKTLVRFLDAQWRDGNGYVNPHSEDPVDCIALLKMGVYHLYSALMGLPGPHSERCALLMDRLADMVTEHGAVRFLDEVTEHPAHCCFTAEALGLAFHYGPRIGLSEELRNKAAAALARIVTQNPRIRHPTGTSGRTQQMRFESQAYYWQWRCTGQEIDRERCMILLNNVVDRYVHPFAYEGGFTPPAVHPDWTWNYASCSGTTTEFATNTHTPVYYLGEPAGFLFVYLHGLKTGMLSRNREWDEFARGYIGGLFRNYSRAGHMASDVDGYGIHRAWYGALLTEVAPYDAAAACTLLDLSQEWSAWFNWYCDRHNDFLERCHTFSENGLPSQFPYGHRINIEKGFNVFGGAKFFAQLARSCFEYAEAKAPAPAEPPAFCDHAWWHHWLRVSTPAYETSTVATTSLRNIPMVKSFGDPHLGCLHGGSPLANLMVGNRLMYATSNCHDGLWHIEVADVNGKIHRSSGTSFEDNVFFAATDGEGTIRTAEQIPDYTVPVPQLLAKKPCQTIWRKSVLPEQIQFWSRHDFREADFSFEWGYRARAGFYIASAAFNLPIPANMSPEIKWGTEEWVKALPGTRQEGIPSAVRWTDGQSSVEVRLVPTRVMPSGAFTLCTAIPTTPGNPGGENSFCPYPLLSLRVTIPLTHEMAFKTQCLPGK
jgi:hypothetical protein